MCFVAGWQKKAWTPQKISLCLPMPWFYLYMQGTDHSSWELNNQYCLLASLSQIKTFPLVGQSNRVSYVSDKKDSMANNDVLESSEMDSNKIPDWISLAASLGLLFSDYLPIKLFKKVISLVAIFMFRLRTSYFSHPWNILMSCNENITRAKYLIVSAFVQGQSGFKASLNYFVLCYRHLWPKHQNHPAVSPVEERHKK